MAFFKLLFLHAFIFFFFCNTVSLSSSASPDIELLLGEIKASFHGSPQNLILSSWNSSVPLCQWLGLKWIFSNASSLSCSPSSPHWTDLSLFKDPHLRLLSLQLPSANLSGSIPRELSVFPMLQSIYLNFNSLTGAIPLELGYSSSLSDIDFRGNLLSGALPPSIWNMCDRLVSLRLHGNSLSGSIPEPALPNCSCENLQFLDFGKNNFSGNFPDFITRFGGLKQLDLGDNMLEGSIPQSLEGLSLEKLNLSHNNFSGVLPTSLETKFGLEVFEGNNPDLCGPPLRSCGGNSKSRLSSGAIAGIVISLMAGSVVLASVLIGYVQNKRRKSRGEREDELEEEDDEENGDGGEGKLVLFPGGENLTLEDVLNANGQVLEKTCYGTVYKAKLADGGTITLRLLREGCCRDRASSLPVIKQLGKIRHDNLVPLRAFYQGKRGEKLLIFDYLPLRTLHDLLHGKYIIPPFVCL